MALPELFLQELKLRNSIEDDASSYVQLKRRGRNLVGLCPFHNEHTPSFNLYPESGSFYCFAAVRAEMSLPLSAALKIWIIWKL